MEKELKMEGELKMKLFTIGYAKKSAEELFRTLKRNNVRKIIDVRLQNADCYCYYTHKRDFAYLLYLAQIQYEHKITWAPSKELLSGFQKGTISWREYETQFNQIIQTRNILRGIKPDDLNGCALLCSEPTTEMCHRRLLAEHFKAHFPEIEVIHL